MKLGLSIHTLLSLAVIFSFSANSASAYIGPGAGLSAIGACFAFFAAIIAALLGFIWYPIKRLLKKKACRKPMKNNS